MEDGPADNLGRTLLVVGAMLAAIGGVLLLLGKRGGLRGLPGDVLYRGERGTVLFPIVTCVVLSLLLTLILNLFRR